MNCENNCGKVTRNDAHLCDDCCDEAARWIGEVPWLDDELDITIARIRGVAYDGMGSGGNERVDDAKKVGDLAGATEYALPIDLPGFLKREALRHALVMAVRFCDEEGVRHTGTNELPADNIQAMSRWLLWRIDGLALNDMGPQVVADVVNAIKACKRAIDKPPERKYAGTCPECDKDLYCRPGVAQASCSNCGSRWDVAEIEAWMRDRINEHLADTLLTVADASTYLGRFGLPVPQRIITGWWERKRLVEVSHNSKGQRMYRWTDLVTLASEKHAQGRIGA